jgi:thioredoxin 1
MWVGGNLHPLIQYNSKTEEYKYHPMITLTDSKFKELVDTSNIPVIIDFWAEWCGPCKILSPVYAKLENDYQGKIKFMKLNIDENPKTPVEYGVRSIPTMIIFKDGEPVTQLVGAIQEHKIKYTLDEVQQL